MTMVTLRGFALTALIFAAGSANSSAGLISDWNFNDAGASGTVSAANTAALYSVDHGNGTMTSTFTANQITDFAGTANGAQSGDPAGVALGLQQGSVTGGVAANAGATLTFSSNTTGMSAIIVSLAIQRTATGFDTDSFRYSTDGVNFVTFATFTPVISTATDANGTGFSTAAGLQTFDLSGIAGLANDPNAVFQIVFNNSAAVVPSTAGNNRIDNIAINGTPQTGGGGGGGGTTPAVPEPASIVLLGLGALGMAGFARRQGRRNVA